MIELSIIIVNWNTKDILQMCIESVYKTTQNISFDIIVVDNGSTDGSAAMVQKKFPRVKLIRNKRNLGFAAANNQGIKKAQGLFILLLNSDTIILDNAIRKTVEFMKRKSDAGAVGCKLLNPDYSLQHSCYNFYSFFKRVIVRKFIPKFFIPLKYQRNLESLITSWDYSEVKEVDYVRGAFIMVRNEVFREVGLLDESFFMYGEEKDLCLRMKRAGWRVYFYPEAQIVHLKGTSAKKKTTEISHRIVTALLFRKKHYSFFTYVVFRLFLFVHVALKYIILRLLGGNSKEANLLLYQLKGICKLTYHDNR